MNFVSMSVKMNEMEKNMSLLNSAKAIELLNNIPANLTYGDWFRVAAALKHEGGTLEDFIAWSSTCPEKYDHDACVRTWEGAGDPDKEPITLGTLNMFAERYGRTPKIDPFPQPETDEELIQQAVEFIHFLFKDGDAFELVSRTGTNAKGHKFPVRDKQNIYQLPLDEELLGIVQSAFYTAPEGAWITFNPIKKEIQGKSAADADVTDFRYVLVEADALSREVQLEQLASLHLPIKALSWSGNKSCHALVRVDAGSDRSLYEQRVKALYEYLETTGFPVDQANKNPARLTRIPGFKRGDDVQFLLAKDCGPASWAEFEARYLKKKEDRRKETSAINGTLGGRPQIPVTDIAKQFFEDNKDSDSNTTLVYYGTNWWRYAKGIWKEVSEEDMSMKLVGYLQEQNVDKIGRIGTATAKDILLNLQAATLAGLPKSEYRIPCWLSTGETGKGFMRFQNGILNLKDTIMSDTTPELLPLSADFFCDKQVDYAFDPAAACPKWMQYLNTTFDDPELRTAMQMLFGYILSGETRLNIAFFFVGNGGDGKSTAAYVLKHMVGVENTCGLPFTELGSRFSQYLLTSNTLNLCEELSTADFMGNIGEAEKTFKIVTDGGNVSTERKFHDPGSAPTQARCVFCTNAMPAFKDRSNGLWDRIVIIPFKKRFRDTAEEKCDLKNELIKELSGIVNWAIQGARMLRGVTRFPLPVASKHEIQKWRLENDHEQLFLKEHTYSDPKGSIQQQELYRIFCEWSAENGFKAVSKPKFNKAVVAAFPNAKKGRFHTSCVDLVTWLGISYSRADIAHEFSDDEPLQEVPPPSRPWENLPALQGTGIEEQLEVTQNSTSATRDLDAEWKITQPGFDFLS